LALGLTVLMKRSVSLRLAGVALVPRVDVLGDMIVN
jgi:hypothetical protein